MLTVGFWKFSNSNPLSKILLPSFSGYLLYNFFQKKAKKMEDDLVKEIYFEVEENYRKFRYSGDIQDLGAHIRIADWGDLKSHIISP